MLKFLGSKEEQKISLLNNPFTQNGVKNIAFYVRKGYSYPFAMNFSAYVEFENGQTEGKQSFASTDFSSLVKTVEEFVQSLEK